VVTDAVFSAITMGDGVSGGGRIVGPTLTAGLSLPVSFTGVTIASGVILAWKAE